MTYLICDNCRWCGDPLELVALTDDLNDTGFRYCPQCGGEDFEEEEDEG